jgi:hypothetical protein
LALQLRFKTTLVGRLTDYNQIEKVFPPHTPQGQKKKARGKGMGIPFLLVSFEPKE